jgi:hypothetical protein
MSRDEIKQSIDDFIVLVEKGCGSIQNNETNLKLLLDRLAMAQHFAAYKFDEGKYAEAPSRAHDELRKRVATRFPNYGYYNLVEDVSQKIGESGLMVGDAIDDIVDITADLLETKWCWEKNSVEDGLWHFKNTFETHWANHLRGLQMYLLNFDRGA